MGSSILFRSSLWAALLFYAPFSVANGFVGKIGPRLRVKIYNHVHPGLGTRKAAVMVLSDPRLPEDKTIIVFKDSDSRAEDEAAAFQSLETQGLVVTGTIDATQSEVISKKNRLVLFKKLSELRSVSIELSPGFSYSSQKSFINGSRFRARALFETTEGNIIRIPFWLRYYLKLEKDGPDLSLCETKFNW